MHHCCHSEIENTITIGSKGLLLTGPHGSSLLISNNIRILSLRKVSGFYLSDQIICSNFNIL